MTLHDDIEQLAQWSWARIDDAGRDFNPQEWRWIGWQFFGMARLASMQSDPYAYELAVAIQDQAVARAMFAL